jgi:regulator of RNase E activity RraA
LDRSSTAVTRVDDLIAMLETMTSALVADALDRLGLRDQTMDPGIRAVSSGVTLAGRALPVEVVATDVLAEEPYAMEMRAIESLVPGDVPVYAAPAGLRAALFGELFGHAARGLGGRGAVVDGFVRDTRALTASGIPVFARGASPLDTNGRAEVRSFGEPVVVGGVTVRRGDYVVGDDDGVVVAPAEVIEELVDSVQHKRRDEHGALTDLLAGDTVRDVWDRWRVF